MRLDSQHASNDRDERCADCGDDSNYQPSIFSGGHASLTHRGYAKLFASAGGLTVVASLAAPLAGLTRIFKHSYTSPMYPGGIYLVDSNGERINESALSGGEKMTMFPEPRSGIEKTPTLLMRHAEDAYGGATNLEYTMSGYVAYSKVCTHAGCIVSSEDGATLICPCHFSEFDPAAGAKVVSEPPSGALPQLPITLSSEGNLIVTGDFNGPVGPRGG